MKTILASIIMIGMLFMTTPNNINNNYQNLQEYVKSCNKIEIIIDNQSRLFDKNSDNFNNISNTLYNLLSTAHEMPAYAVSLDSDTKEAIKQDCWIKLIYNNTMWYNDMNFDCLLINVNKEDQGFNIIRGNNNIYEGRCYYIALIENDMTELFNTITNMY